MNSPESFVLIVYKVRIPGERFWINVLGEDNDHVYGTVANCLISTNQYKYGDLVKWHKHDEELSSIEYNTCPKNLINHLDSPISTLEVPIIPNMIARWVPINNKGDRSAKCQCCDKAVFQFAAPVCKEHYIDGGYDRTALGKKAVDTLNAYINENPILELDPIIYEHDD